MTYHPRLGVDPGTKGGVAVLDAAGAPVFLEPLRPAMFHREVVALLLRGVTVLRSLGGNVAVVELVGYRGPTTKNPKGDGGQGAFTFGQVDGLLRGALHAFNLKVVNVRPQMWQARMECLTAGDKNISKDRALELFESACAAKGFKITHNTADALLIARFGQLQHCQPEPSALDDLLD